MMSAFCPHFLVSFQRTGIDGKQTDCLSYVGQIPVARACLGPFLMQSDSASRKRPLLTGLFFDWILLVLLFTVSRVDFIVFVLFLEAVGVRSTTAVVPQSKSVGSSVLRAFSASNGSANPRPSELVALGLAERRQSYVRSWSCTQPRAAKATAAAAVVGSMGSRPRAAAVV